VGAGEPAKGPVQATEKQQTKAQAMDHPAPRILIVEDDQRLAELTAEYLQANGYEVSVEGDGARAARRERHRLRR